MKGHPAGAMSLVFSPNGRNVLSGGIDGDIRVWDVSNGKNVFTIEGHGSPITTVAITADGSMLASGSYDRTFKLWHIVSDGKR